MIMEDLLNIIMSKYYAFVRGFNYLRYDIPQGIRNLIEYAPVIWSTREWDYIYLYRLMAFKLRRMEQRHREARIIADWEKVAREIQITAYALERFVADEYPAFVEFCKLDDNGTGQFDSKKFKRDLDMSNEDFERALAQLKKHSRGWWD